MSCRRTQQRLVLTVGLAASFFGSIPYVFAQSIESGDVALFKLYDVDARFSVRYLLDNRDASFSQSSNTFEDRTTWEEELFILTRSFVYHPGFLNIDFGGGPLLVQQKFASLAGSNSNSETLINALARFNFLDLKSYPFSLYYERSHPSVTTSLSGRFLTEANLYGFEGRIGEFPWSSALDVAFTRRDQQGFGLDTVVDQANDAKSARWFKNYWGGDQIQVSYSHVINDSLSGSAGLPITESRIELNTTEVRTKNTFGQSNKIDVDQFYRRLLQDTQASVSSSLDNRSYSGTATWRNPDDTRISLRHRANDILRDEIDSRMRVTQLTLADTFAEDFSIGGDVSYEDVAQTGFTSQRLGASGSATYRKETGFGSIAVSGNVRKARTDQLSDTGAIDVFDEPVTLVGTLPVDLANEFVIQSSVVVRNAAGTQIFVEGLDYRLLTVGSVTSIQRLITGNIMDGQSLLVDYQYNTSGTAKYESTNSGISVTAQLPRNTSIDLRYSTNNTRLLEGEFTLPKNDANTFEIAINGDYPLRREWSIGGRLSYTDRNEEISPSVRQSLDVHLTGNVTSLLRLRLGSAFVHVDQKNSPEDVDLQSYRASLGGRLWQRVNFNLQTAYLTDTGGSLARKEFENRLQLNWGFRQVNFSLVATVTTSMQGSAEREYTHVSAEFSRIF